MSVKQSIESTSGAEAVRWDLTDLYKDLDDPKLSDDLEALLASMKTFHEQHAGNLATTLGQALADQATISCLADKLMVYLFLRRSTDASNQEIQQKLGQVQEAWSQASANYLTFFEHELVALGDEVFAQLLKDDPAVAAQAPYLAQIRENRDYLLEQNVERALTLRAPYGAGEWSDYIDEMEAELRFQPPTTSSASSKPLTLPEILHVANNDADAQVRAEALQNLQRRLDGARLRQADGAYAKCGAWCQGGRGR